MIAVYPVGWLSPTAEKLQEEARKERGDPDLEVYEKWETAFSPVACVVDFRSYQSGRQATFRGIWRIVSDDHVRRRDDTDVVFCHEVSNIRGLGLPKADLSRWAELIGQMNWEDGYRSLYDFAREARSLKKPPGNGVEHQTGTPHRARNDGSNSTPPAPNQ